MPILGTDNFNFANILINKSSQYVSTNYISVKQSGAWTNIDNVYKMDSSALNDPTINPNWPWVQIWPTTGVIIFDKDTTVTVPPGIRYADILVIGGGGGGGQGIQNGHNGAGGGGGGGGVLYEQGIPVTAGTQFNIIIGQGGAGAASNSGDGGGDGGDTSVSGCVSGTSVIYKAFGGTGGSGFKGPHGPSYTSGSGCCSSTSYSPYIGPGGSGGGGYSTRDSPGVSPPTPGGAQGYSGEYGATNNSVDAGGGGGGAGGAGLPAAVGQGGAGGDGFANSITGQVVYYAGGGAGGVTGYGHSASSGGKDGGGSSGQDATGWGGGGGGGGAGSDSSVGPASGNGHQGAVIVNFYSAEGGSVKPEIHSGTGKVSVPTGSEISYGGGGGGGACFLEYTMVMLHDGRLVPISEIQIGDLVWNHDNTAINEVTMVECINDLHVGALYSPVPDQEPFATVNHPLYIDGKLSSVDPEKIAEYYPWLPRTELIDTDNIIPAQNQLVYNLWVTGDGTYTVNGYGTTSIIGDGGSMARFVRKGQFTPEIASETVLKVTKAGSDTSAGGKYLNDLAGRLNWPIIDWLFVRGFATDRYPRTQQFLMMVFAITGKIIKRFR